MKRIGNIRQQQPLWQGVKPEAPIKALDNAPVFVKGKGVISAGQARLEISLHRIDPLEFGQG